MKPYFVAPKAYDDLAEIVAFLLTQSVDAASRVLDDLEAAMLKLAHNPDIGRQIEDLANIDTLRFWPVHSYLIIYRSDARPIQIIRVLHGSRDVETILDNQ